MGEILSRNRNGRQQPLYNDGMPTPSIYLDNNATTPIDPRVVEAMTECYRRFPGNPASQHAAGRAARRALEEAREEIGGILGAKLGAPQPDRVIFTSGATEANNLAIRGILGGWRVGMSESHGAPHVIVSAIEHPSISGVADQLATEGVQVSQLPVSRGGVVKLEELPAMLTPQTRLVCIMLGSNETGALQPVAEAAAICRAANVPLHCDAVQVAGKLPVDFRALGASMLSVSAHKFHGPRGVGALLVHGKTPLAPLFFGGFQQAGLRPGSEPVALAVGLATALKLWREEAAQRAARMQQLRDQFESLLRTGIADLVIHAQAAPRLPHASHLAFPGLDRQALLMALDLAGVACSAGSSCASGSSELSPTLLAMGVSRELAASSLRFSFSAFSTAEELGEAAGRILKTYNDLRRLSERPNSSLPPPALAAKPV